MNLVWLKLIKRILTHKYYVAKYCFQIGLYWQGSLCRWRISKRIFSF